MPKFSIIIPVYNVERYIKKCLDSVFNQTFKDFEVIVVNDGTKDNSVDLIKDYKIRIINEKNQGLSVARNTGIKNAKGDYLIFLDGDDYIEDHLLEEIDNVLDNNPDVVRFQVQEVFEDKDDIIKYEEKSFNNKSGVEAFKLLTGYHFVENAWSYAVRKDYFIKNKFMFKPGAIHEDFGLMPLLIMKAKIVNSISYIGYDYLQRSGSIMSENDYAKTKKKVNDFYNHYLYLIEEIDKTGLDAIYFKSFIANSLIIKVLELNKEDYKDYIKKLKEIKVFDNLLDDSFSRKIKKIIIKLNPKLYYINRNGS